VLCSLNSSDTLTTMNNTFDNYDTELQCEEYYQQPAAAATTLSNLPVLMWLMMQSLQVKVWHN